MIFYFILYDEKKFIYIYIYIYKIFEKLIYKQIKQIENQQDSLHD